MTIKEEIALINKQTEMIHDLNQDFDNENKLDNYVEALNNLNKAFELLNNVDYHFDNENELESMIMGLKDDVEILKGEVMIEVKEYKENLEEENPFEESEER